MNINRKEDFMKQITVSIALVVMSFAVPVLGQPEFRHTLVTNGVWSSYHTIGPSGQVDMMFTENTERGKDGWLADSLYLSVCINGVAPAYSCVAGLGMVPAYLAVVSDKMVRIQIPDVVSLFGLNLTGWGVDTDGNYYEFRPPSPLPVDVTIEMTPIYVLENVGAAQTKMMEPDGSLYMIMTHGRWGASTAEASGNCTGVQLPMADATWFSGDISYSKGVNIYMERMKP